VSVINKMLQELDRRNAAASGESERGPQAVKSVRSARSGHEWFWRVTAVLVLASVAWVGWVAYQLQPRTLVTPLALRTTPPAPKGETIPTPKPEPVAQPTPEPVAAAPELTSKPEPVQPSETFKLARSIETPIAEPKPKAKAPAPAAPKPAPTAKAPVATAKPLVDKRERGKPVNEAAEAHFRRAAALLNQGRVSEAEEHLLGALQADPSHVPARQAYVALLLEQQRVDAALRLLREAVAVNPSQPTFSLALARIHVEQRDYRSALEVIDRAGPAAQSADFQALRGAVLQRLGRHGEAVSAYQKAVQGAPQVGGTWTGLGISLEALGRGADAAQAYQRALGSGPLASELREYAEARIRALQ
jgi:MSHA biogenesis protein MshN